MKHSRTITAAALLFGALTLPACVNSGTEGGWLGSYDNFTYNSTSWQPKTVTLFDTRTGESLWSVDIPVGKSLNVGFKKGSGPNEFKPDEMVWEIRPAPRLFGTRDNRVPVPPSTARRLEMTLRSAPEMPREEMPGNPYAPGNAPAKTEDASYKAGVVPPAVPVTAPRAGQPAGPELQPQPPVQPEPMSQPMPEQEPLPERALPPPRQPR